MFSTLKRCDYHKELVRTLFEAKLGIYGSSFIFPLAFFFIFYSQIPLNLLYIWISIQMLIFTARIFITTNVLKSIDIISKDKLRAYLRIYLILIFINAFLWGTSSILSLMYGDEIHMFLMIVIVLGIITAGISTLSAVFHAIFIFSFIIISMLIGSLVFIGGTQTDYLLASFAFFYFLLSIPSGFKVFKMLDDSILQKEKINLLNKSLKEKYDDLEEKNNNFQNLFDTTMEAIIISDEKGNIINCNKATLELFLADEKENFVGKNIVEFVPEGEMIKVLEALSSDYNKAENYSLMRCDGTVFPALASGKNIIIENKKLRISVILDLSTIKAQEKQLLEQSRLVQMGEMISMIAHQWRQPLGAIASTSIDMKLKIELDTFDLNNVEDRVKYEKFVLSGLDAIEEFTQNLTTTIDDFRDFYKPNKASVVLNIKEPIQKALNIVKGYLDIDSIEVIQDCNSLVEVEMFDSEVMQVILNILKNAQENFQVKDTKNAKIMICTKDLEDGVLVKISDNGGGVDESALANVFNPYFSTKRDKNGTGLGMYMSKLIISEHHNGDLSVENNDDGACFYIKLGKTI